MASWIMTRFAGSTNITRWLPAWKNRVKQFEKKVELTPRQIAEWGALKSKTIAPRDTGALIQAISWKSLPGQKTKKAMIFVRDVSNPRGGKRPKQYTALHHSWGGRTGPLYSLPNQKNPGTGDYHWLFTIRQEAKEKFRKGILSNIEYLKKST